MNFPFLDGDVLRLASYGVYNSQLIRFARVSSHVDDFNTRNKVLTAKLLRQGYRYHKNCKAFSKFYRRHFDIVSKYNVGLKTLLLQGLSEPEFYGDLEKIIGKYDFPYHFKKIIVRYKKICYNIKAALLYWFFSDLRCGVPLFIVMILVRCKYKISKNKC